jgi:hypothetical protein
MVAGGYRNILHEEDPGLTSIVTVSPFGIGQQAFLVQTPAGNVLWDCISHLDEATIAAVCERGGIQGIAISHPHFYATCVEWSETFGGRRSTSTPPPPVGDATQPEHHPLGGRGH